jgi:hypothetical protein
VISLYIPPFPQWERALSILVCGGIALGVSVHLGFGAEPSGATRTYCLLQKNGQKLVEVA